MGFGNRPVTPETNSFNLATLCHRPCPLSNTVLSMLNKVEVTDQVKVFLSYIETVVFFCSCLSQSKLMYFLLCNKKRRFDFADELKVGCTIQTLR